MNPLTTAGPDVGSDLLDQIAAFPTQRQVTHCGISYTAPPFDIYATCPACGARVKVRSFGGAAELEDVFDAVFAWMNRPEAQAAADARRRSLAEDD